MKKVLSSLVLCLLTVFAACGSDDEGSKSPNKDYQIDVQDMGSVSDIAKVNADNAVSYTVTLEAVSVGEGSYRVFDKSTGVEITEEVSLTKGTVIQIISTPAEGYALDQAYAAVAGGFFGPSYEHTSTEPTYEFPLFNNVIVGAAFMQEADRAGYEIYPNIKYGETTEKHLVYDVYVPTDVEEDEYLPVVFIIHGGGWTSGDPSVMIEQARQLAKTGNYVVCLPNYRFIGNSDGGSSNYDVTQQIEDCMGGMAHFMNLDPDKYHADTTRFCLTGDSAGGHLSAALGTIFDNIGTAGFNGTSFELWPTSLAQGDVASFKEQYIAGIKAMAPSYGIFDLSSTALVNLGFDYFSKNTADDSDEDVKDLMLQKVSPEYLIQSVSLKVPCWQSRGSVDMLINLESVQRFTASLTAAGWADADNQYFEMEGANHAFYDWKPNTTTQSTYSQYGEPGMVKMIEFFDKYCYTQE